MLDYRIDIIKKDVKIVTVKVKPTGEVILTAPVETSDEYIQKVLQKRKKWIEKKLEYFKKYESKPKELVSGENFEYLGRNYRLKIYEAKNEATKLQRGYFELHVKDKNDYRKKEQLIKEWYYEKALYHYFNIVVEFNRITKKDIKDIRIRQMKTRWGSCNSFKGFINLNLELIKKPKPCVEYVIFHELVHLIHPNHSKEFYQYMTLYMPDWQKRKGRLENEF